MRPRGKSALAPPTSQPGVISVNFGRVSDGFQDDLFPGRKLHCLPREAEREAQNVGVQLSSPAARRL